MAQSIGDLLTAIYSWGTKDKIFYKDLSNTTFFVVGETITGGTSLATGKITAIRHTNLEYTLTSGVKFVVNETVTGGTSGDSCKVTAVNTFHTSIGDKFYFDKADPTKELEDLVPFTTYRVISGKLNNYYTGAWEDFLIQFSTFSNNVSASELILIDKYLCTLFDRAVIPISNWNFKSCVRQGTSRIFRDVNDLWNLSVDYTIKIQ